MYFWLRSYAKFEDDTLTFSAEIKLNTSFLQQLSPDELFTLAAILQHESLSAKEHADVFHQDKRQSRLLLDRLANKGFLVRDSGEYEIQQLLYNPIVKRLEAANIIY